MKAKEKNGTHVTFDHKSAILSLTSNLRVYTFTPDSYEVYFKNGMRHLDDKSCVGMHDTHFAFPSAILEYQSKSTDIVNIEYLFL